LLALAASGLVLGAAHAFERFGGYAPCILCLRQREAYWTAGALAAVVWLAGRVRPGLAAGGCAALALVFLYGAGLAGFHAGVEWGFWPGPEACSGAGASAALSAESVAAALGQAQRMPSCAEAPWRVAGLSMAGYNALIALGLALASAFAATRRSV
jgi:disulfide bond formation protein DsbB